MEKHYVVFFDGYCGLCNKSVNFLIKRDKYKKFKYSPLQGEFVKTLDPQIDYSNLSTLYVYDGKKLQSKTQAWRTLALELGGIWETIAVISKIFPIFILDFIYDCIAKYRYKFFGELPACRVPNADERERFIP